MLLPATVVKPFSSRARALPPGQARRLSTAWPAHARPLCGSAPASWAPPARAAAGATQRGAIAAQGTPHRCSGRSHGAGQLARRSGRARNRAARPLCMARARRRLAAEVGRPGLYLRLALRASLRSRVGPRHPAASPHHPTAPAYAASHSLHLVPTLRHRGTPPIPRQHPCCTLGGNNSARCRLPA